MRFLVTGANGMLGHDVVAALPDREVTALGRDGLDITDATAVRRAVVDHDVVINCAAYTKVDDAEVNEDLAVAVNGTGVGHLAEACAASGARLVTVSTDYVFDGKASAPYAEDRARSPLNAYGRSKAVGEELALSIHPKGTYVVRTAWLYGAAGPNFGKTMLALADSKPTWSVVDDQLGQPTWTADLATQMVRLVDADAPAGVYHGTNAGQATWFEFARAVLVESGLDPDRITPTDSTSFARPAPRPSYSVLGHDGWTRVGIPPMRHWREALKDAIRSGALSR